MASELELLRAENAVLAAALRETNELIAVAPAFFGFLSPEGVVLNLNDLALQVIEARRDQVVGALFWEAPWWSALPDSAARIRRAVEEGARGVDAQFDIQYRAIDKGVDYTRWVQVVVTPSREPEGHVTRIAISGVDVTERRQAQAAAETANRAKDEFLALLGHELRNPLAPIVTALELMKLHDDKAVKRERDVIERQVRHVSLLVDDLLDVSRITRNQVALDKETIEIASPIATAVEIAAPLIEERAHHLKINVSPVGLRVDVDPIRISQVIANLLTNAAKYTPPNGQIQIDARREESQIVIEVSDSGIGISADLLPRVFEIFVQGARPLDRPEGGLGIGLALVSNLVRMHGGSVDAHSEGTDRGSRFTVRLPVSLNNQLTPVTTGANRDIAPLSPGRVHEGQTRRILIVDDNVDAAELLAEILTALGHEVLISSDAPKALTMLDTFDAEVAILDIGLPVMNGYELAQRILQSDRSRKPRLVAMTGYGQLDDLERSRAAGFDEHLVKPVEIDALLIAIGG